MAKRVKTKAGDAADPETLAFRTRAREAAVAAIDGLLLLAGEAKSEAVKLAAIKELLDRGFGRVAASAGEGGTITHLLVDDGYAQ